MHGIIVKSTQI